MGERFDATTYGRSFADVYDDWYPSDAATDDAVVLLDGLLRGDGTRTGPARALELGIGTGRLALPLAALGHDVVGVDASQEMLTSLRDKLRAGADAPSPGSVEAVLGDVADTRTWPDGPVELVLAAFNMVFNLTDADAQASLFDAAFAALSPGGVFVVECFVPAPLEVTERLLELRSVDVERVVLIATESDPATSTVTGQHIELRDGEPVRLRPWRIRVVEPAQLDAWATAAGFEPAERSSDWRGSAFDADSASHVSVYRRPDSRTARDG